MSAFATIAGLAVIDLRLTMPRYGVWVAEASLLEERTPPSGAATLVLNGHSFVGTVEVGVTELDATVVRMRGGAGGFGTFATPKHYTSVPLSLPCGDLLSAAGEKLSSTADQNLLNAQLHQWTVAKQPIGAQFARLLASQGDGVCWRVLSDGTVWLGREQWPGVTPDYQLIQLDPLGGKVVIASLDVPVLPGDALGSVRASYVEHSLLRDQIRTTIWAER